MMNRLVVPQPGRERTENKRIPTTDALSSFKGKDLGDEERGSGGPEMEAATPQEHKAAPP
jgi:hypothetical protein